MHCIVLPLICFSAAGSSARQTFRGLLFFSSWGYSRSRVGPFSDPVSTLFDPVPRKRRRSQEGQKRISEKPLVEPVFDTLEGLISTKIPPEEQLWSMLPGNSFMTSRGASLSEEAMCLHEQAQRKKKIVRMQVIE